HDRARTRRGCRPCGKSALCSGHGLVDLSGRGGGDFCEVLAERRVKDCLALALARYKLAIDQKLGIHLPVLLREFWAQILRQFRPPSLDWLASLGKQGFRPAIPVRAQRAGRNPALTEFHGPRAGAPPTTAALH